jgi:hypothetical protein
MEVAMSEATIPIHHPAPAPEGPSRPGCGCCWPPALDAIAGLAELAAPSVAR